MEPEDRDTEIFERIPWEALERPSSSRWWVYATVAAAVLAAVGFSAGGRMWASPETPVLSPVQGTVPTAADAVTAPAMAAPASVPVPAPASPVPSTTTVLLSEADLMAGPIDLGAVEAAGVAEWYVAGFFTRDGTEEAGRSFVDFARTVRVEWSATDAARVTVAVRRLAAPDDEPYQRLPPEVWEVEMRRGVAGWAVIDGPASSDLALPDESVVAPDTGSEWSDGAGLTWVVAKSDPK